MKKKNKKNIYIFISSSLILILILLTVCFNKFVTYKNNDINEPNYNETIKEEQKVTEEKENKDIIENKTENKEENNIIEESKKDTTQNQNETKKENSVNTKPKENNSINEKEKDNTNELNNSQNTDTTEKPKTKTQEEINNEYRNSLESIYGVNIAYGNEMGNYQATSASVKPLTDPFEINKYLKEINTTLSKYPSGFFKEIKNFGMPITIYLVDSVSGSAYTGIFDRQFTSDLKITVVKSVLMERTLHHELFHYIDLYIEVKIYPNSIKTNWENLNPDGFTYGITDTSLTFNMATNAPGAYFLTDYAQTNYKEDRATLFADMISRAYAKSYYNKGEPLHTKAVRICEELDKYFTTVNSHTTEYWERFIY